jgi:hypothetical protein
MVAVKKGSRQLKQAVGDVGEFLAGAFPSDRYMLNQRRRF